MGYGCRRNYVLRHIALISERPPFVIDEYIRNLFKNCSNETPNRKKTNASIVM